MAQNLVRQVAIAPCSLPQAPLEPGCPLELHVEVTTEDGEPLPYEVAKAGLTLRLKALSPEAAAAACGDEAALAATALAAVANGGCGAGGSCGTSTATWSGWTSCPCSCSQVGVGMSG